MTPTSNMAPTYWPRHPIHAKNHLTNKETPREITNYITKNNTHTYPLPNQLELISAVLHYVTPTHTTRLKQKTQPHLKSHPVHSLHLNPHTTAPAYRPRHTNNNTYYLLNHWKTNSVTNQIPIDPTKLHFLPHQVAHTTPAQPNLFNTTKLKMLIYVKINKKNPEVLWFHRYYFINKLELLKCGDIEVNPGPMPNILHTHPTIHKKRANLYFIPNTIKLQPEYQHIAKSFAPIIKLAHPFHLQAINTYPHLHQYIQTQRQSPLPHVLYALIITIHPSINTCNNILAQPQNYHFNNIWTTTLILRLANLTNPPERNIRIPHPYTTFVENYQDIILPKNSLHKEIYDFIHNRATTPNLTTLQNKFPFLPHQFIVEALRCLEHIDEYSHPPPPPTPPAPPTRINNYTERDTNIITWNASSLNTSLPNLQSLIKKLSKPHNNHTYSRNQINCQQIYKIHRESLPGIQTHFQQHTCPHKMHTTKTALYPRKRRITHIYPQQICIPWKCHQNSHASKYLPVPTHN